MSSGSPATLSSGIPRARLDHVRIKGALHQEARVSGLVARHLLEHADEGLADRPSLDLGVADAGQALQEAVGCLDVDQIDLEVASEGVLDLLRLAGAEQPMVHEDTDELVAHGPVHQSRSNR
jgi:hypothetical protein